MKQYIYILFLIWSTSLLGQDLQLLHQTQSSGGIHQLYLTRFEGLPVFNQQLKINQYRHRIDRIASTIPCSTPNFHEGNDVEIIKTKEGYLNVNEELKKVQAVTFLNENHESYTFYYHNNTPIHYQSHQCYYKDTTVHAKVFNPDPITSSGMIYEGDYVDNNDNSNASLEAQLVHVIVPITYDADSFRLENQHIKITNHSSPDIKPTVLHTDNFEFNRSQTGFEELNAIYHITKFAQYIKDTLNYPQIMNYQVHADVYALGVSDNSQFINSTTPPRLSFGVGGIDDAEDADILIHEYTHGITFSTAPGTLNGHERKALDEGIGDYFAAVYSKSINENNYQTIFNWDGHNEFWDGRSINNTKKYSTDMENQIYKDGELFASLLMKIRNTIPDTIADKIILESTFNWFSNMTFKDAGIALLNADTALYGGSHSPVIHWALCQREFITVDCTNSTQEIDNPTLNTILKNDQLSLQKLPAGPNSLSIYDLNGKLVLSKNNWNNSPVSLSVFNSGTYYIIFKTQDKVYRNRIILQH